tara:strand:- start:3171 stop:4361 length:1191 start_codon:yes stop_codon:yes gene_type:complete
MKHAVFSVLVLTLLMVWGFVPKAYAIEKAVLYEKPMPEMDSLDFEAFKKDARMYKKRPYQQDVLAYKIYLPQDWKQGEEKKSSNFLMNEKLFQELSVFYGPPKIAGRSKIVIQAINMKYDLTAKQWYIKYILESGYTMQGFVVHHERKVESLMIVMENDIAYGLRTLAHINGDKVILTQYYLPLTYWEEEKSLQEAVIKSFDLVKNINIKIGKSQKFQFLDVAEVFHPAHWQVAALPFRTVERMTVKFLSVKESMMASSENISYSSAEGNVDVVLVSKNLSNSLIEEIKKFRRELEGTGLLVGDKLKDYDVSYKTNDKVSFSISEVYEGIDSNSDFIDYELWFTVMVGGNYFYFLTLLTPSQQEDYIAWAKNTRGYKEIVETFTPMTGAFIDQSGQ